VELLGYANGEDDLYLVYEYVPNGSLSDHLHDPLLKGTFFLFLAKLNSKIVSKKATETEEM